MYRPFFLYGDTATPPETDDPPVLCTACGRAECNCGNDVGAASQHAAEKATGSGQSNPPSTAEPTASPAFCPRCNRTHVRSGEAEERCQEVSRFIAQDHRRRGGEG